MGRARAGRAARVPGRIGIALVGLGVAAIPSVAAAQLATRCAEDALVSAADRQGRNAWAASCSYITAAARDFYDSVSEYLVFTAGCGNGACSPFIPVVPTDPCVPGLIKLGTCSYEPPPVVLSVSSEESAITVTAGSDVRTCPGFGGCDYQYPGPVTVTLRPTSTRNLDDCATFAGWDGACAGQGATCTLALTSNASTTALWSFGLLRCVPR